MVGLVSESGAVHDDGRGGAHGLPLCTVARLHTSRARELLSGTAGQWEAWTVAGTWWHQRVSGDGGRQIAVAGNILFHAQNEFATLQWSAFSKTDLGPSHDVQKPTATATETQPTFETYLVAVDAPQWKDAAGHYLVAYAAEM